VKPLGEKTMKNGQQTPRQQDFFWSPSRLVI
jgi:hypothetical protein